ncbi:MAG: hypothetical protein M3Z10_09945, partial [Gemmatimonadota bacterium]|nr:hypothetical protein [Gemmatimonadota bacterium]
MRRFSFDELGLIKGLTLGAALWVTVGLPGALHAQASDTVTKRALAPGVIYRHIVDKRGPLVMHVVTVNLRNPDVELREARAHDQLKGREKTSEMVRRVVAGGVQVPAAVNADFFELGSGENENEQVLRGEWWKGLKVTDSPYDTYDNVHVQFGLDAAGRPVMDRYILDAKAWDRGAMTPIVALNFNPSGKPEGTALFTARYGAAAPHDTTRQTVEATLTAAGRRGDTLLFVRRGPVSTSSGSAIPPNGAVLA